MALDQTELGQALHLSGNEIELELTVGKQDVLAPILFAAEGNDAEPLKS